MIDPIIKYSDLIKDDGGLKKFEKDILDAFSSIKNEAKKVKGQISTVDTSDTKAISDFVDKAKTLSNAYGNIQDAQKKVATQRKKIQELSDKELQNLEKEKLAQRERIAQARLLAKVNATSEGSIENLRAKLSLTTSQWAKLTKEEAENTDAGRELNREKKELTETLFKLEKATGDNRRNVGNYSSALDNLNVSFKDTLKQAGLFALGIAGVNSALGGIGGALSEIGDAKEALSETATITGLVGSELDSFTAKVSSVAKTFGKDYSEVLLAANANAKRFNISQLESIDNISKGFIQGADQAGDYLNVLAEYPGFFEKANVSQKEFIRLASIQVKEGIYGDKLIDSIKEATIRLEDFSPAVKKALAPLGEDFAESIESGISSGELSIKQALLNIRQRIAEVRPNAIQLQAITADIFGGAGEDALGAKLSLDLFAESVSGVDVEINEYQKTQEKQLKLNEELAKSQVDLAKDLQPFIDGAKELFTKVATVGINIIRGLINVLRELPTFLYENRTALILLSATLVTAFSGSIIRKVASYSSAIKKATLNSKLFAVALKIQGVALKAFAVAQDLVTGKVKLATIAKKAYSSVISLLKGPTGLLATAVIGLAGAFIAAAIGANKQREAMKRLREENENTIKTEAEIANKFVGERVKGIAAIRKEEEKRIQALQANNATEKEIAEAKIEGEERVRDAIAKSRFEIQKGARERLLELQELETTIRSLSQGVNLDSSLINIDLESVENGLEKAKEISKILKLNEEDVTRLLFAGEGDILVQRIRDQIKEVSSIAKTSIEDLDNQLVDANDELETLNIKVNVEAPKEQIDLVARQIADDIAKKKIEIENARALTDEKARLQKELADLELKLKLRTSKQLTRNQIDLEKLLTDKAKERIDIELQLAKRLKEVNISSLKEQLTLQETLGADNSIDMQATKSRLNSLNEELNIRESIGIRSIEDEEEILKLQLEIAKIKRDQFKEEVQIRTEIQSLKYDSELDDLEAAKTKIINNENLNKKEIDQAKELSKKIRDIRVKQITEDYDLQLFFAEKGSLEYQRIEQEKANALKDINTDYANNIEALNSRISSSYDEVVTKFSNLMSSILEKLSESYAKATEIASDEVDKQNDVVEEQRKRAEEGKKNSLKEEKEILVDRERELVSARQKEERIERTKAFYAAYIAKSQSGNPAALAETIAEQKLIDVIVSGKFKDGGILSEKAPNGVFQGKSHDNGGIKIPVLEFEGSEGIFSKREMNALGTDNFKALKSMLNKGIIGDMNFSKQAKEFNSNVNVTNISMDDSRIVKAINDSNANNINAIVDVSNGYMKLMTAEKKGKVNHITERIVRKR